MIYATREFYDAVKEKMGKKSGRLAFTVLLITALIALPLLSSCAGEEDGDTRGVTIGILLVALGDFAGLHVAAMDENAHSLPKRVAFLQGEFLAAPGIGPPRAETAVFPGQPSIASCSQPQSFVLFDDFKSDQRGELLDLFSEITKGCSPMASIFVDIPTALYCLRIVHLNH